MELLQFHDFSSNTLYRKIFQVIMGLSKEDTIGVIATIVEIVLIALLIDLLILVMLLRRRLDQKRQRLLALLKKNSHNNVRPIEDEYDYCKAAETTIVENRDQEDTTSNCIKSTVTDVQVHLSANECYSHIRNCSIISDSTYEIIDDYCKAKTTIVENSDQEDTTSNNIKSTVADVQVHLENGNDSYEIIDYLHADSMSDSMPDCYPESPDYLTVLLSSVAKPEEQQVDRMQLPDCSPESPDLTVLLMSSQAKLEEQHANDHYMPLSELTLTSETSYASLITVDTCAARVK